MAFTNFYLVGGGAGAADVNAGSSTGAAQATTTNGNWDSATGIFIAASGTPFASTIVGDYASIYVDGATVAVFVAKVTTVTSNVNITVDVASIKYGTAPSTSATARSCTINGAWATEQVLAAGGLGTTTVPQSTKINITGNLTVTASRTISMAGATTTPLWFSAYAATPGDLDADTTNSLTKPLWTFNATFSLTCSGTHAIWSGLALATSRNGDSWTLSGALTKVIRCRNSNTNSSSGAIALTVNSGTITIAYSYFKCPATATGTGVINVNSSGVTFIGVVADTAGLAGFNASTTTGSTFVHCVAINNTGSGFLCSTGQLRLFGCTIYNPTGDGVKWSGAPSTNGSVIVGCLFANCGGYGINNGSGANTNTIFRACNDFYACTPGPENGMGDSPAFFGQTDSTSPITSATDLTPVAGSNARAKGFPGIHENESFSSYANIGAVQQQDLPPVVSVHNVAIMQPRQIIGY